MKNKGVIIAVVVLLLIGVAAFIATRKSESPVSSGTETAMTQTAIDAAVAPETPAAPDAMSAVETSPEAAPADTAATDTAPAATTDETAAAPAAEGEQSLLAAPAALQIDVPKIMQDRVLGKADAPVTMIEYASYTCPHCAHYANDISPEVKKQLVDTGKVKFVFREFPIDAIALKASMMARCAPEDKFFDLMEVIFKNQERWITSEDPQKALMQYGNLAGMDDEQINACINNEELQNALLKNMQDAQTKYSIKATPTFVLNDGAEVISGAQPVQTYIDAVNTLIAKQ